MALDRWIALILSGHLPDLWLRRVVHNGRKPCSIHEA